MEFIRRPTVLAALAAAVLSINVLVITADGEDRTVTIDDDIAAPADGANADAPGDGDAQADAAGDGTIDGNDDGADGSDGSDGSGGDAEQTDGQGGGAGLTTPVSGTYEYAAGGSWSLSGAGEPEEYQLPATATGIVRSGGEAWELELVVGERYTDAFSFSLGADGGLDWDTWDLEREFRSGRSTTPYTCSGDSAYYRPGETDRTSGHGCETAGITSEGSIEHVGSEDVTLGDGTVVTADRLIYTYTVSGEGVGGEGRLDLWLDPSTGMRVREVREINTTTTDSQGNEFAYREQVEFTLMTAVPQN